MLLTITTTHEPATDLGYLLHKNPARVQSFTHAFGHAHVFYPEAGERRCTVALLLDIDPIGLSRRGDATSAMPLQPYVNDRPYVASSFLSVAIAQVFGTALQGRSQERAALADSAIPLEARVAVVASRGGEGVLRRLFEPLGYEIALTQHALDGEHPEWGEGNLLGLELRACTRLRDLLAHLYVLLPVLDDDKHYWVGSDEVEKLLRHGEGWLARHAERDLISRRYLKHRTSLVRDALTRLADDDPRNPDDAEAQHASQEEALEEKVSLNDRRLDSVLAALHDEGARTVLDLGCGEGKLLRRLVADRAFERVVGLDVSHRSLEIAADRLGLERMAPGRRERVELLFGSLVYRDKRLAGFDAAAIVEVVEHLDPARLEAFTRVVFEHARPRSVVLTTPNTEYNVRFTNLPAGRLRHADHRFEWTRSEFDAWARAVAVRHRYTVRFAPVGDVDAELGPPTQMAVFRAAEVAS